MLDTDTKRRIDTARDILVGKVPDPKSQVEQITIALIYKFMDDMDAESEELGGTRKFFAGDFARYGWPKLMRSGLGGHETLNLYAEAISKMPENPGIPLLFREIFKNAYLPYRDPETLKSFLKVIDEFNYDHSERLGDAFEYLLSVLGSQGDAGQFRTPRHIIDFMVDIINPQKNETILDPACGTAGFLISAYKHILKSNSTNAVNVNGTAEDVAGLALESPMRFSGDLLTPDDRTRLARNIKGYDISPDMVRLSLVNLYLHGFADPKIEEYDTLTSDEKWTETADVIFANPPFMSPKGGIKPHTRFQVQSKRSEVLFVDYIAEHLTPNGRAAIIVPEGIIFQSQSAYVALRKMLVENDLAAVISLPAGVFNPYSGVKTSIFILDRAVAKASPYVAFFKIENDGFQLGAQRKAQKGSQLPQVKTELSAWLRAARAGGGELLESALGSAVERIRLAGDGNYNLSAERYGATEKKGSAAWDYKTVGGVCEKITENVLPETLQEPVEYIGLENIVSNVGKLTGQTSYCDPSEIKSLKTVFAVGDILYGKLRPNLNKVWRADRTGICSTDIFVLRVNHAVVHPIFLETMLRSAAFNAKVMELLRGAQLPRVSWTDFSAIEIPLPPLEVQREIVVEVDEYQRVIDGARIVLDNYRPHIPVGPEWINDELQNLVDTVTPPLKLQTSEYAKSGKIPIIDQSQDFIAGWTNSEDAAIDPQDGVVIFGDHTCAVKFVDQPFAQGADGIKILRPRPNLLAKFLAFYLSAYPLAQDGYRRHFSKLKEHLIRVPPMDVQIAIVAEIEAEQVVVNGNRDLITRLEKRIAAATARVWNEANADAEVA